MFLLVLLATVALMLAVLDGYVDHVAINSSQFADRSLVVARDPSVQRLIAQRITHAVIERVPLLAVLSGTVQAIAAHLVATSAFRDLFRASVLHAHQALISGSASRLTLRLGNLGGTLAAAIGNFVPSATHLAGQIDNFVLVSRNVGAFTRSIARAAGIVSWLWAVLAAASLACTTLAIAVSRPRRRALIWLGLGIAVAGALLLGALLAGRGVAVSQVAGADARATVGAIWDTFLGELQTISLVLLVAGVMLAATAGVATRVLAANAFGRPAGR